MIRGLVNALVMVLATVLGSLAAIVAGLFDRTGDRVVRLARLWARVILGASGIRVDCTVHPAFEVGRPYVFMANHASMIDIWAVLLRVPGGFRMIAKKELGWIPLFGWALRAGRYIFIDRGNPLKARRSVDEASRRIAGGVSVLLFPEGTRTRDGSIGPFKKGGFHLAIGAGVPIVPVAIRGAGELMPRSSPLIRPGRVEVEIGEPIATSGYQVADRDQLVAVVRNAVVAMVERSPIPAARDAGTQ